jgi:hypothetical protein
VSKGKKRSKGAPVRFVDLGLTEVCNDIGSSTIVLFRGDALRCAWHGDGDDVGDISGVLLQRRDVEIANHNGQTVPEKVINTAEKRVSE